MRLPRKFAALLLLGLFAVAATIPAYGDGDVAERDKGAYYKKTLAEIKIRHAEAHYEHGVKLFEKRAYNEAANEFTRAVEAAGRHKEASKYLKKTVPFKGVEGYQAVFREYWKTFTKIDNDAAAELAELGAWCAGRDMTSEARRCYEKALEIEPGNAAAKKFFGFVKVRPFGWVKTEVARKINEGLLDFDGKWLPASQVKKTRKNWATAWVLKSGHYELRTNCDAEEGRRTLDRLELLYALWRDHLLVPAKGWEAKKKLKIHYFATRDDLIKNSPRSVAIMVKSTQACAGVYNPYERTAYYYKSDVADEVVIHESTHQIFDAIKPGGSVSGKPGYWVSEGAPVFAERFEVKDGVPAFFGTTTRSAITKQSFKKKALPSIAKLDALDYATFNKDAWTNYRASFAVASYLMLKNGGKWRRPFLKYALEIERGRGKPGLFKKTFGYEPKRLQAEFDVYMRDEFR